MSGELFLLESQEKKWDVVINNLLLVVGILLF